MRLYDKHVKAAAVLPAKLNSHAGQVELPHSDEHAQREAIATAHINTRWGFADICVLSG